MITKEKVRLKIPILLTATALVALSLAGSNTSSSTPKSITASIRFEPALTRPEMVSSQATPRFSSAYTALTKCGRRMANGKPFAIIMRVYEYAGDNECAMGGKITGESLMVMGLKGYEHINETVEVKGKPNPNLKARELADKGYAKPKS